MPQYLVSETVIVQIDTETDKGESPLPGALGRRWALLKYYIILKSLLEAEEMAQWVQVLVVKPNHLSLIPKKHSCGKRQKPAPLTSTCAP